MIIRCPHDAIVSVKDLKPNPLNRNSHPKDQIERLAKVLEYQGWRYPIKVSKRSGLITSGHGRLEAAKLLKWKEVPVSFQDYDSEEQEYADTISDNSIASWSELDLSGINSDLTDLGPDFDIDLLGIKDFVLEPIEKLEPQCDEDEIPDALPEPKVVKGEVYILGNHRLMCGDSTAITDVERLMGGSRASICFTSPPYNLGKSVGLRNGAFKGKSNAYKNHDDDMQGDSYLDLLKDFLSAAMTVTDIQLVNLQMLSGNKFALIEWMNHFKNNLVDALIWAKLNPQPAMAERVVNSAFEFVFIFDSLENPNRAIRTASFGRGKFSNVYSSSVGSNSHTEGSHGATFPVALAEHYIENLSEPKCSVYEPFAGSGTTGIACEKTDRHCFMMELDPHYCGVILDRWQKFTGKKAQREDGVAWDEIKAKVTHG